ncbi:MAG: glycerol-3-phosphate acyltransferase [Alphaproteobacteria bacterium]|jgi:acyl phosphate:glycerol-3-phosphate acyltransferase|nr:glycerol-3-phosphate acyltransferase [Alphaproteobacteria bacterium]
MTFALAILIGYLLGSVPFGVVLTRLAGKGDIRAVGSGNIGATNVLRTGSKPLALAVLLLDGAKGAVAVIVLNAWAGPEPALMAGIAAMTGHLFPIWLRLGTIGDTVRGGTVLIALAITMTAMAWAPELQRVGAIVLGLAAMVAWGGKGVATGLGVLAGVGWPIGVVAGLTWLAVAGLTRRSSMGALAGFVAAPIYCVMFEAAIITQFAILIAVLVFVRHRSNIARLIRGSEPKIGASPDI